MRGDQGPSPKSVSLQGEGGLRGPTRISVMSAAAGGPSPQAPHGRGHPTAHGGARLSVAAGACDPVTLP